MKVHLAYEYADEKGKTHAPNTDVAVDAVEGRRRLPKARARQSRRKNQQGRQAR